MGDTKRPAIPREVYRKLLDLANEQCAICHRPLLVDEETEGEEPYIGQMAHIIPVSPRGERGDDPGPANINEISNLLPLCRNCHAMTDQPSHGRRRWPTEKLRRVKREHEAWVALERCRPPGGTAAPARDIPKPAAFKPGEPVTVSGQTYWIVPEPRPERVDGMLFSRTSPEGDATWCAAYGYAAAGAAGHVWLRRVRARRGSPAGDRWRAGLAGEAALLTGRLPPLPGLPEVLAIEVTPDEALVVTALPSVTSMAKRFGDQKGTTEEGVRALLRGLGTLCEALSALHDEGFAHGVLDPAAILIDRRGHLVLRDLGQAMAPDAQVSPESDTRMLATLTYRLATGFPPATAGPPVPAAVLNPLVAAQMSEALDRALRGEIREVRSLAGPLRAKPGKRP